jgi:hypothetical protein
MRPEQLKGEDIFIFRDLLSRNEYDALSYDALNPDPSGYC